MNLVEELRAVTGALTSAGIEHALCGGLAVVAYGYVRATKDIDLLLLEEDVERALRALAIIGFPLRAGPIPFATGQPTERRLYRATKVTQGDHLTVDLMVVTPVLQGSWNDRVTLEWGGQRVPIVSRTGLALMKRLAGRPQDLADLLALGLEIDTDGD